MKAKNVIIFSIVLILLAITSCKGKIENGMEFQIKSIGNVSPMKLDGGTIYLAERQFVRSELDVSVNGSVMIKFFFVDKVQIGGETKQIQWMAMLTLPENSQFMVKRK